MNTNINQNTYIDQTIGDLKLCKGGKHIWVWFEIVRAVLGILARFVRVFISERELEKAGLLKHLPLVEN